MEYNDDGSIAQPHKEPTPLWKLARGPGQPRKFGEPKQLWDAACAYFQWCDENPLLEEKAFHAKGDITRTKLAKMRPYTLGGLCIHAGMAHQTWLNYKLREEFLEVCEAIERIIYEQKFAGAAAELLNPSIIARELGLADKQEVSNTLVDKSDEELTKMILDMIKGAADANNSGADRPTSDKG